MGREYEYKCTRCDRGCDRDLLTVKRAVFLEMGERPKQLRARNVHWLCPSCVAADPDWNRNPHRLHTVSNKDRTSSLKPEVYDSPDLDSALKIGSPWQNDVLAN